MLDDIITYSAETLTQTKHSENKLKVAQPGMERIMVGSKRTDKITTKTIRQRTIVVDIIQYTAQVKWRYA